LGLIKQTVYNGLDIKYYHYYDSLLGVWIVERWV